MSFLSNKTFQTGRFLSEDPTNDVLQALVGGVAKSLVRVTAPAANVVSFIAVNDATGFQWTNAAFSSAVMQLNPSTGTLVVGAAGALQMVGGAVGQINYKNDNGSKAWVVGAGGSLHDTNFIFYDATIGTTRGLIDTSGSLVWQNWVQINSNSFGYRLGTAASTAVGDSRWYYNAGTALTRAEFATDNTGYGWGVAKNVSGVITDLFTVRDTGVVAVSLGLTIGGALLHPSAASGLNVRFDNALAGTISAQRSELHMTVGQTGTKYALDAWTYVDHAAGTTQVARGVNAGVEVTSTGTVTTASAHSANGGLTGAGTIGTLTMYSVSNPYNLGGGTLSNVVGLSIAQLTAGSTSNLAVDAVGSFRADYDTTANELRMLIADNGGTLQRLKVGGAGTGPGGVGKALYI